MKYVDLSVELAHGMVRYPSPYLPDVEVVAAATHESEGRAASIVRFGTHVSTHIDAPFHAIADGKTVEQLPVSQLCGPARVLRFLERDASSPLDVSDFEACGDLNSYSKILLDTGWLQKTWGQKGYFTQGPFLTREAARFLAGLNELHMLGMDFPNVDALGETVMGKPAPNHQILLGREIILLENLINLHELDEMVFLSANPPKLVGGDGCPCRAVAITPLESCSEWSQNT